MRLLVVFVVGVLVHHNEASEELGYSGRPNSLRVERLTGKLKPALDVKEAVQVEDPVKVDAINVEEPIVAAQSVQGEKATDKPEEVETLAVGNATRIGSFANMVESETDPVEEKKKQLFFKLYDKCPAIKILLFDMSDEDKKIVETVIASLADKDTEDTPYHQLVIKRDCSIKTSENERTECIKEAKHSMALLIDYLKNWVSERTLWNNVKDDNPYPPHSMYSRWWFESLMYR